MILCRQDQIDGPLCGASNFRILRGVDSHAMHFRQHECRDAVTVHARIVMAAEVPLFVLNLLAQHIFESAGHGLAAIIRLCRTRTDTGQRHDDERSQCRVVLAF